MMTRSKACLVTVAGLGRAPCLSIVRFRDSFLRAMVALIVFVFWNGRLEAQQNDPCAMIAPAQVICDPFTIPDLGDPEREPVTWRASQGVVSIIDNSLNLEGSGSLSRAEPVGVSLSDVSVRTQVTAAEQTGAIVQLRFTPGGLGDTGYFAGIHADGTATISFSGNQNRDIATAATDFDLADEDLLMQFDAIGNELSLYLWRPNEQFPESPTVQVIDDSIPGPGQLRLGVFPVSFPVAAPHSGTFRFAQVATQSIPIPEPSSVTLGLAGLIGLFCFRQRMR